MESFTQDTFDLLDQLNATSVRKSLEKSMSQLARDDAISDSIISPFMWRRHIAKCMTWHEALLRIWRKMQIRGLISFNIKFPLNPEESSKISRQAMIRLATDASRKSSVDQLKLQKRQSFIEMYRSVPLTVLEEFRNVYKNDFLLFNYTEAPDEVFQRREHFDFLNVTDFRS